MGRSIFAAVCGGIILFFWSFLSWVVLSVHDPSIKTMANEDAVLAQLKTNITQKGVYYFPNMPENQRKDPKAIEIWTEKYRRGPTGFILFDPAGNQPMKPSALALSFLLEIVSAGLAIWFYKRSAAPFRNYFVRATYFGMFGIFICVTVYFQEWIHIKYPLNYTLAFCADAIIGWLLAGFAIAAIIKPASSQPQSAIRA